MNTRVPAARVLIPATLAAALAMGLLAVGRTSAGGLPTVGLGLAEPFAVLAGTPSIENTGLTVVTGNLGIAPALAVNGFGGPPNGTVVGETHAGDTVAGEAKAALATAYDDAAGRAATDTDATIGGRTLVSGVYNAGGATLDLTGTVILDGQNNPDAVWIFQATSDLVTASSSVVSLINGAQACNVFWQVTSSATLGSSSVFAGTIMALSSVTVNANVAVNGRLLARNGTVTLISDIITRSTCATVTPTVAPVAAPVPTATPQLPNTALDEGVEMVVLSPLFAIIGVIALTTLVARRSVVRASRPSAGKEQPGGRID